MHRYPDQSVEAAIRYLPVVRICRDAGVSRVLEVGSGDLGLTPYSQDFELTGLDVSFHRENPEMKLQVEGSVANLPFEDREFDAVVSVDSLEFVPRKDRELAVMEILRCSHRLAVIAVPSGCGGAAHDRLLRKRYREVHGEEHPVLREIEGGLPEPEQLEQAVVRCLRRLGRSGGVTLHRNSNLMIRSFLMKGWISRNRFYRNLAIIGLMPLAGLLSRMNWGRCYRTIVEVDM